MEGVNEFDISEGIAIFSTKVEKMCICHIVKQGNKCQKYSNKQKQWNNNKKHIAENMSYN